jgi:O-antigen/teichoic acid export membrane protein
MTSVVVRTSASVMPPRTASAHAEQHRARRLKYAIVTSLASKGSTAVLQLVAIPVAVRTLGTEGYASYANVTALAGLIGAATITMGPALAVRIAAAAAENAHGEERRLATSAILPVTLNALALVPVALLLAWCWPLGNSANGADGMAGPSLRIALAVMAGINLLQCLLAPVEAAQLGYQEQHLLNLRGLAGNLITAAAVLAMAWLRPSVLGMVIAMFVPQAVTRLANAAWFLEHRPFLLPRWSNFSWPTCRMLLAEGVLFTLVGGAGAYLCHQFPVLILDRLHRSAQTVASFAAGVGLVLAGIGVITMLCVPLWPALADSLSRGDTVWAVRAYRRVLLFAMTYAALIGGGLALFGGQICRVLFGHAVQPSAAFCALLGAYFVLHAWEYVHYMLLLGMKCIALPSLLYLVRALLTPLAILFLCRGRGDAAPLAALCLTVLCVTAATFPCLARRTLAACGRERER